MDNILSAAIIIVTVVLGGWGCVLAYLAAVYLLDAVAGDFEPAEENTPPGMPHIPGEPAAYSANRMLSSGGNLPCGSLIPQ